MPMNPRLLRPLARHAGSLPPPDPYFSSVSLLLHMDGANNSTTFTDSSSHGHAIAVSGDAKISTAQSKFGGSAAYFDGAGDYVTTPDVSQFGFGTGDFTIEYWYYYDPASTSIETHIDNREGDNPLWLVLGKSADAGVRCYDGDSVRTGGTMTENAWNHIAWCRGSGENLLYLNGQSVITFTNDGDAGDERYLVIGTNSDPQYENTLGYIDEVRITKGVARYTAAFTPPGAPFPNYGTP